MRASRPTTRLAALVLLAVLLAGACQPDRRDPASIERILVVGDSVATGVAPYGVPGWAGSLGEQFPNAQIVVLGGPSTSPVDGFVPGTVHSDWSGQVNHWLSVGFDADLVFIQGCCNDYTSPDVWRGALDAVVTRARGHDPGDDRRIVMVTTPRMVPGYGAWYRANGIDRMIDATNALIRQTPGVALADLDFAWSVNWGPTWIVPNVGVVRHTDGLHLNAVGSREAARVIARA